MAERRQAGANATDVPHLVQLHRRLALKLVEDRRAALEALGDIDSAIHLTALGSDVVAEVRGDPGERLGVEATPPGDGDHRVDQLIESRSAFLRSLTLRTEIPTPK